MPIKVGLDVNTRAETKRQIIAELATVYDPIGLITPMITKAKNLVQRIWQMSNREKKYGWDNKLTEEIIEEWVKIKKRAMALNTLEMPRWVHTLSENNIQIHGFCDASQKAFTACVYIRACKNDSITTTLFVSKAKNAPVNQTILRLELCGAHLLVQLVDKVCKTIDVKSIKRAIGEKHLTIEEMNTLLCQVEAVVNSRPICALGDDPNDLSPLTPTHFLNMSEME